MLDLEAREKSRGRRREGGREESDDELAEDEESRLSMFPVEGAWVGEGKVLLTD